MQTTNSHSKGYKEPVMVYVQPEVFKLIEANRGAVKRSTFCEMLLENALMPKEEVV
ncbi:hypothetical protein [Methanosarcina mazei]|uniref:hypothetical protein n=1 Tax=Methanosarcina mazei TaxID=2209 RepID=UPI0013D25EE5|nr:hypothetical protein [Methanosarcina mazei]